MPSAFEAAGSRSNKQTRYAPITMSRWFTGLWTQRSPLRDAATPYLFEKFYSGSRFDSLIAGSNVEVSNKLTLQRRPGHTVYNSATFSAITAFYEFRSFINNSETIHVMADTSTFVYDATGPSTQTPVFTKSTISQSYFQGVANTLFMGDGADLLKWRVPSKTWASATGFQIGDTVTDSNGNLQRALGGELVAGSNITVTVSGNVLSVSAGSLIRGVGVGYQIRFEGLSTATFLNGQTVTTTAGTFNDQTFVGSFTAGFSNANFGPTAQTTGSVFVLSIPSGASIGNSTSGGSAPTWATSTGAVTVDNQILWINQGAAVSNWGITTPTTAPSVANALLPSAYPNWTASTFYSPSLLVQDDQGTPHLWKLTTAGNSASVAWTKIDNAGHSDTTTGAPTGNAGTDVWVDQGQAAWQANHAYTVGRYVSAQFSKTITRRFRDPETGEINYVVFTTNYSDLFKCIVAGTSGPAQPVWSSGFGTKVTDGASNPVLTWVNQGNVVTGDGHPVGGVNSIAIGTSTPESLTQTVLGNNQRLQAIYTAGKSGAGQPTWPTAVGTVTADNTASWIDQGAFGTANTAAWQYVYAFKNSLTAHVGTASPVSAPILQALNNYVAVGGSGSSDPQVDTVEIFRTAQGGSILFFLADIPNPGAGLSWSYSDNNADSSLNTLIVAPQAHSNDPPPAGLIALTYHLGRIWGAVGNIVYYSSGPDATIGSGNESFPPLNFFIFPSQVVRLEPNTLGLLVHTLSDIYLIAGSATSVSPLYSIPFLKGIGLANYNAYSVNGSIIYLRTSDGQIISLDPSSGVSEVGFPIGDLLQNFSNSASYLTWHVAGSADKALYVADGSTGWYRLSPTSAPESGLVWSPKATIAAGVQAVQSVETTPGVKTLLLGPTSSGPILQRSLSSFSDNGSAYTASATIGSVVLAQPGQLAELQFIAADSQAVGTRPTVSVLMDEISGSFESLTTRVADPPMLPASVSLFGDRYYFSSGAAPAWCRHMQIQFSWPAEAFKNELLSYTIFGAHHQER